MAGVLHLRGGAAAGAELAQLGRAPGRSYGKRGRQLAPRSDPTARPRAGPMPCTEAGGSVRVMSRFTWLTDQQGAVVFCDLVTMLP